MSRSKAKEKQIQKILYIAVVIIAAIVFAVSQLKDDDAHFTSNPINPNSENMLIVHYLDVGQGDSEFIELPDGSCMLIDAGESAYGESVVKTISGLGYEKIDYLIATHPHSDHIGGLTDVINSFDIENVYMPRASSNSYTYEKLLKAIKNKGLKINTVTAGTDISPSSDYSMKFIAPCSSEYDDLNDYSAVLRLEYNGYSFLFTGDAEELSESEMLNEYYSELDCDVLKVGHHGSHTSTSQSFLNAVSPEYAVISCGKDNSYGHPHKETLSKLYDRNITVLRTDQLGSITFCCDGEGGFEVAYEMDS